MHQRGTAGLKRGAEGGGRGNSGFPGNTKPSRSQGRVLRDGGSATPPTTTTTGRTWKPNVHRPLEWFPVPARQVLLVDPNDVKATAAGVAEEARAARTAGRSAEPRPSSRVDLRPIDEGAVGDRGSGNNGDAKSGGTEDCSEHRREGRGGGPQDREAKKTEGGKQRGSAKPTTPQEGHGYTIQESSKPSEIVLSARSTVPSAASLVDLSCSPRPTGTKAGARATARARLTSGSYRARPHTSASRAWGRYKRDAPSGGVLARKYSAAMNFMVSPSQTKARVESLGGNRRTPEVSHREMSCVSLSALGGGPVRPFATPESTRRMPPSPNELQGERAGGGSGGRVDVRKPNPHRQRRAGAAAIDSPASKEGGLQVIRLPVRATATASHATSAAQKEKTTAVVAPGPPREMRHPSREASTSQPQRAAISGWEGEEASVTTRPQERGVTSSDMGGARDLAGDKMPPTAVHSDNSLGDVSSVCSADSSVNSSYCGWNKTSSSQKLGDW